MGKLLFTLTHCKPMERYFCFIVQSLIVLLFGTAQAQSGHKITLVGEPAELSITPVSEFTLRISLHAVAEDSGSVPLTDGRVLAKDDFGKPIVELTELATERIESHGRLRIKISPSPLSIEVATSEGKIVQSLSFDEDTGAVSFKMDDGPVYGLGNGGQHFNRRGSYFPMQRGHRYGEYLVFGARTPIPLLMGTEGWSLFFHRPYNGSFDLRENPGKFIPADKGGYFPQRGRLVPSGEGHEHQKEAPLPLDFFVTHLDVPERALSEYSILTGKPAMPPKWSLGYMQSHRNLSEMGSEGVMQIARTFREKKLPIDALIYLGTGFTPVGWDIGHDSFQFHPNSFPQPQKMIDEMGDMNIRAVLHLTHAPKELHGSIPPKKGEHLDPSHVMNYWKRHKEVFSKNVAGWWPDMGDELKNDARLSRHYMYQEGPLTERPNERPWSLHRTGFAGMQRFGGWNWSGDVNSSWKTLEAHVPVGINASLSTSPFWGTDIGGFYPTTDLTGELFVRWFQFGTFNPSFRSHGVVWRTRLPWGWNPGEKGPMQVLEYLKGNSFAVDTLAIDYKDTDLHTNKVEPIIKKYLELRYRLMPYLYTAVRQTYDTGIPIMRALWLHYPQDPMAVSQSSEYLWGRNMLIAPVTEKGIDGPHYFSMRNVYLPEGNWYDFWRPDQTIPGKQTLELTVDLTTMPIFVKAGTILPLDPVRQYVDEPVDEPMTLRIYPGTDASFLLYDDDGRSMDFLKGEASWTSMTWDNEQQRLTIEPGKGKPVLRKYRIYNVEHPKNEKIIDYKGRRIQVDFK